MGLVRLHSPLRPYSLYHFSGGRRRGINTGNVNYSARYTHTHSVYTYTNACSPPPTPLRALCKKCKDGRNGSHVCNSVILFFRQFNKLRCAQFRFSYRFRLHVRLKYLAPLQSCDKRISARNLQRQSFKKKTSPSESVLPGSPCIFYIQKSLVFPPAHCTTAAQTNSAIPPKRVNPTV